MIHPVRSTPVSYLYNPHATNAPVSDLFLDKNFYEQVVECDILIFFVLSPTPNHCGLMNFH